MVVVFSKDIFDEGRVSFDCIKRYLNDFGYSFVEVFVDYYFGNEDFEGEYRFAKRVRKVIRRYIEEILKVDDEK